MYGVFPFALGIRVWDSLLQWGKGSETPSFPRSEHEERESLRPFSTSQEGVWDPFSQRKKENPVHPQIPLAQIQLAQRMILEQGKEDQWGGGAEAPNFSRIS